MTFLICLWKYDILSIALNTKCYSSVKVLIWLFCLPGNIKISKLYSIMLIECCLQSLILFKVKTVVEPFWHLTDEIFVLYVIVTFVPVGNIIFSFTYHMSHFVIVSYKGFIICGTLKEYLDFNLSDSHSGHGGYVLTLLLIKNV